MEGTDHFGLATAEAKGVATEAMMNFHNLHDLDDIIERFSMRHLEDRGLADFEMHLLQCRECQENVRQMDLFLYDIKCVAEPLPNHESEPFAYPAPTRLMAEYVIVQAALPTTAIENIGILLLDAEADRLYCRFRHDFEAFAGDDEDWFKLLPDNITEKANELGAQKYLEWMESTLSNTVRTSTRKSVVVENYATTVNALYKKHVKPTILRFRTHLPQYSLEAAAGKFGRNMTVEPEGWIEVLTDLPLTDDMFVAHVKGDSMEPLIPDSSLCAFRSKIAISTDGKILLLEHAGNRGGNRYTVKLCNFPKSFDPNQHGNNAWAHHVVVLESINPAHKPWGVTLGEIKILGEFLFVV